MGPALPASWHTCLLHWINCILKCNIQNIKDLADWRVFFNLINNLDENKNESDECFKTAVNRFLRREYPHFNRNIDVNTLENVEDIVLIASLLLHYSCMKRNDDAIRGTMCRRLDIADQKAIMLFANNLIKHEHISDKNLINAITASSMEITSSFDDIPSISMSTPIRIPLNVGISPAISTTSLNSPLTTGRDELKATPASHRSRKVFRLEAELGAERFDRNFLQEELNRQNKKVNELEKMNKTYISEIQRLHGEFISIGNSNCDDNTECGQCAYKEKLIQEKHNSHRLEVLQMESNAIAVEDERDLLKTKLEDAEKTILEWRTQAVESENNSELLKLELDEMNVEINNLKTILADTTKCLEEYRRQNNMNISIECDDDTFSLKRVFNTSLNSTPENLGKAVVDVQLKEQINRNCNLMEQIDNLKKEKNAMNDIIKNTTEKLNSFDSTNRRLIEDNNKLSDNLQLLQIQQNNLTAEFNEQNSTMKKLVLEKNNIQDLCDKYILEIKEIENNLKCVEDKLNVKQIEINDVIEKYENIQSLYKSNVESLKKCEEDCANKNMDIEELHRTNINLNESNITMSLKINLLEKSIVEKEEEIAKTIATIDDLLTEKNNINTVYEKTLKDVEDFVEKLNTANVEINNQRNQLEETNAKNNKMHALYKSTLEDLMRSRDDCVNKNKDIEDLHEKNLELGKIMQEKNVTFTNTIQKLEEIILTKEEQINIINVSMCDLLTEKNDVQCRFEESVNEVEESKIKLSSLREELVNKCDEINVLSEDNNKIHVLYESSAEKLKISEDDNVDKIKKIDELNLNIKDINKTLSEKIEYHEKFIAEKEIDISNANQAIDKLNSEKNNLQKLYENSVVEIEALTAEKNEISTRYDSTKQSLNESEKDCLNKHNCIEELQQGNAHLVEELNRINSNVEHLMMTIKEKEEEVQCNIVKLDELSLEKNDVIKMYETSLIKIEENNKTIASIREELNNKICQFEVISEKLQNSEEDCLNKHNEIEDLHQKNVHLNNSLHEIKATLAFKEESFEKLIFEKEEDINNNKKRLEEVLIEKDGIEELYEKSIIEIKENHNQLSCIDEELKIKIDQLERITENNNTLQVSYQLITEKLQESEEDCLTKHNEIEDLRQKNICFNNSLNELEATLASKVQSYEKLISGKEEEIISKNMRLEEVLMEKDSIQELYEKSVIEIKENRDELSRIDKELKIKMDQLEKLAEDNNVLQVSCQLITEKLQKSEENCMNKVSEIEELQQRNVNINNSLDEIKSTLASKEESYEKLISEKDEEIKNKKVNLEEVLIEKDGIEELYEKSIIEIKENHNQLSCIDEELKIKIDQLERITENNNTLQVSYQLITEKLQESEEDCLTKHNEIEDLRQKNICFNNSLNELEATLASKVQSYEKLISGKEEEIISKNMRLEEVLMEKDGIQELYEKSVIEIKENRDELSRIDKELKIKMDQLEKLAEDNNVLQVSCQLITEKLQKSEENCMNKVSEIEELQQRNVNINNSLDEIKSTLASKEESYEKLISEKDEEIKNKKVNLEEVLIEKDGIEELYEKSIIEIKENHNQLSCIDEELKIKIDQLERITENNNTLQVSYQLIAEQLQKSEDECVIKNKEVEDLQQRNVCMTNSLDEVKATLASKEKSFEKIISEKDEEIKNKKMNLEEVLMEKNGIQELYEKSIIEIKENHEQLSRIDEELKIKIDQLEQITKNGDTLQISYQLITEKLQKSKEDCLNKNNEIKDLRQENIAVSNTLDEIKSKVEYFEILISEKEAEISNNKIKLDEVLLEKNDIQELYKNSVKEINEERNKLSSLDKELKIKMDQLEKFVEDNDALQVSCQLITEKLQKSEEDCMNKVSEIEELQQRNIHVNNSLDEIKATLLSKEECFEKLISEKEEEITINKVKLEVVLTEKNDIQELYEKSVIEITENRNQVSRIDEELKIKMDQVEKLSVNNDAAQDSYRLLLEKLQKFEEDCLNKQNEIEDLSQKNVCISNSLNELEATLASKVQYFEKLISGKDEEITSRILKVDKVLIEKNGVQELYEKSIIEIKESHDKLSCISDELNSKNNQLETVTEKLLKSEENCTHQSNEIKILQQENVELTSTLNEIKATTSSSIQQLEVLIAEKDNEISNSNKSFEELSSENSEFKELYKKCSIELEENEKKLSSIKEELKYKNDQFEMTSTGYEEIKKLYKSITEEHEECSNKIIEIENLRRQNIHLEKMLNETISGMSTEKEHYEKQIGDIEDLIKDSNKQIDELLSENNDIKELYDKSIIEIEENQRKIFAIDEELKNKNEQLETLIMNNDSIQLLYTSTAEKLKKFEDDCINKDNEVDELAMKNNHLESKLASKVEYFEKLIENKETVINELLLNKNNTQALYDRSIIEIEDIQSKLSLVNEELKLKTNRLETITKDNIEIKALQELATEKINKYEEESVNNDNNIEELRQNTEVIKKLTTESDQLSKMVNYKEEQITNLYNTINELTAERDNIRELHKKSVIQIEEIQKKLSSFEEELKNKSNQLQIITEDNIEVRTLYKSTNEKLQTSAVESTNKNKEIEELRNVYEERSVAMKTKIDHLEKSIEEKEDIIINTKDTIAKLISEKRNVQELYEKSVTEFGEHQKMLSSVAEELKNRNDQFEMLSGKETEIQVLYKSTTAILKKFEEDCSNKNNEIEKLLEKNGAFESKLENFEQLIKEKEAEIKNSNATITGLLSDKNNIQELYNKSVYDIKKYEDRLLDAEMQIKLIAGENNTIKLLHEDSIDKLNRSMKECELKDSDIKELNKQLKELELKNTSLIEEKRNVESHENSELKLQIDLVTNEKSQLTDQIKSLNEKLNDANMRIYNDNVKPLVEFDKMLQDNLKLAEKLKQKDAEIDEMRNTAVDYNALKTSYDTLFNEYKKLQNQHLLGNDASRLVVDLRNEYEDKLTRMKQKMKQLYQDQIAVYSEKQKGEMAELEALCKKYTEKIKNYEGHVNQLSSELWKVGEKLLMEKNEKDWLKQQLHKELGSQMSLNSISSTISLPQTKVETIHTIKRQTMPRGDSKYNISNMKHPDAKRHLFKTPDTSKVESGGLHMSDEETELFDNTYLEELKTGVSKHKPTSTVGSKVGLGPNRLSELQWRNSLCLPHLKSSYPAETQFHKIKEELIKTGAGNLDDSLNAKGIRPKKEAGQTSYKRPGPPTPSKKGGRASLQGNELRDPLKEHNDNLSKKTTPSRIKSLFMGNTSKNSTRDENTFGTPKSKRLSIFRKPK